MGSVSPEPDANEINAFQALVAALTPLDADTRVRLLQTAATFLQIKGISFHSASSPSASLSSGGEHPVSASPIYANPPYSDRADISPKEFMLDKEPKSDVERVACIAFYLTHYRDMPEFKTLDISKLNTEAAQIKFSNPTVAVDNATKIGFIVPSSKGQKQIGALGEQFVRALPNREAAAAVRARIRPRKTKKTSKGSKSESAD